MNYTSSNDIIEEYSYRVFYISIIIDGVKWAYLKKWSFSFIPPVQRC